ncbi:5-guanidino-2-oxopentanoate decarboxylase [Alisedimentitalea sp. MJ-SS2]|uniref:5-guanidino-2-oxopentanoate decarboxylase n=1 Tax=Aliisedimentitalea sp. MJ-SS2 TaxID=3049795 RepID=UPI002910E3A5|nr:5-guanidino-2-oxopentanoate decarboxylase [Alisedimentitalea sp. MJ-SS2]MDU8926063.1 5-guanidino-2-oxopentanoate decarboxylase [Alisedimentitalea sp. MJ-SS2]
MKRPLGAQISHMLKDRGVDTIFGIPGVHNIEMYRGIEEAGITHILARHEQGAGFMADGYARATGKPGVAYVITGPGLTNIMTAMGQAYSDSVPMLVISSCLDETAATRGQLHQMKDQRGAAATVCDWSEEARTAEAAYQLIDRAFLEFQTRRKRPKHVQVPISLLSETAAPPEKPRDSWPNLGNHPHREAEVRELIKASRRPLVILGGGAVETDVFEEALDLIYPIQAAVFETYAGRGIVPTDYPFNFGATLGRPMSKEIVASADLVIAIGTSLDEGDLWRSHLGHKSTLVRIDIEPAVLADRHRADVQVLGDCRWFLSALTKSFADKEQSSDWSADEVAQFRSKARSETDAERPGIVPICDALRECLPEDTLMYSDMTQFAYVAKEVWDMAKPGLWHHPTGFGTLGYALPAAIGGAVALRKLGALEPRTIAIAGDYGFQYTLQELGTAVELGLPLPILIWDNAKLKEIEDSMVASQIAPNAVVARNPDFLALARAYGAHAVQPGTLAELQKATLAALRADRPTLIRMTPDLTA